MKKNIREVVQQNGLSFDQILGTQFIIGTVPSRRASHPPLLVFEAVKRRAEEARQQIDLEDNHQTSDPRAALDDVIAILDEVLK